MNDKAMQAIEKEMAPILAAFADEIIQNEALFARIKAVYDAPREAAKLTPEQLRLVEVQYRNFARRGAALGAKEKARLEGDQRQARDALHHVLAEPARRRGELHASCSTRRPTSPGCPTRCARRSRSAAEAKKLEGQVADHEHALVGRAVPHVLVAARPAREGLAMWVSRGDNAGAHDNKPMITRSSRCAASARSCSASRATRTGSSTTTWRRRPTRRWR